MGAPLGAQEHRAQTPAPESAGPKVWKVGEVQLSGAKSLPEKELRGALETKEPDNIITGVSSDFSLEAVKRDQRRLIKLYQEHGFFEAKARYSVLRNFKTHKVSLTYTVEEGPASKVRKVELSFKAPEEDPAWRARLEPGILTKKDQRFNLSLYEKSKANLARLFSNRGHPLNQVLGQVRAYPDERYVDLIYVVKAGPKAFFGPVEIQGNQKVQSGLILRELTFKPGQTFNLNALEESEQALLRLGYFRSVNFEPQTKKMLQGRLPVLIKVQERNPHSIRFGLGYGTEDRFRLRITQTNRNVLGLGDDLSFEGKLSSIYQGLIANWSVPYVPTQDTGFILEGGRDQRQNEAYTSRSWFGHPRIKSRYKGHWSWFLGYNFESIEVTELVSQMPDPEAELQTFIISSIPAGISFDTRDSILNPTRGLLLSLQNELSLSGLGSDLDFVRPIGELSFVLPVPVAQRVYFAARIRGGMVVDLTEDGRTPLIRRFFPGGADSVRGYPYQQLGPLDQAGNPLGGVSFVESNFELRFPVEPARALKGLGGVLFFDAGNAWSRLEDTMDMLRFTTGVGLRYDTPLGPIRADLGYQINPPEEADFGQWQAYLSVGQAF